MGNDGNRRLNTVISAINTSKQVVKVLIEFFGIDGKPLSLPFANANGGFAGEFAWAAGDLDPGVEAGPSLLFHSEAAKFGWARISFDTPGALVVSTFVTTQEFSRLGVFVHKSGVPVFSPVEIGIENSPSSKLTWLGIVNPGDQGMELALTARRSDGTTACEARLEVGPGQMIWKTAQSLVPCQRTGSPNYTLHIEPLDGDAIIQSYYDYGNLLYAAAPVHDVTPEEVEAMSAERLTAAVTSAAAATVCRPTFDPNGLRLTSEEQVFEVTVDFSGCNSEQMWILRKATSGSTWFSLLDGQNREVASITGTGTATFRIKVDEAPACRYSGSRKGTIYLSNYTKGKAGTIIAIYQFTQPIPKL